MAKAKLTENNFKSALTDVMRSARGVRDQIQTLVTFALTYYVNTGNSLYLTMIRREAEKRSGISVPKLDGYIRHMVPVTWAEAKDGKMVYKKSGEAVLNAEPEFTNWADFKRDKTGPSAKKALEKVLETYAYPKEDGAQPSDEDKAWALSILSQLDRQQAAYLGSGKSIAR